MTWRSELALLRITRVSGLAAEDVQLLGVVLGVVLGPVPQLLDRLGDVPVAPAVPGDGVEDAEADLALDGAPDELRAVAWAQPHPAADLVARLRQEPADPQADHAEAKPVIV